MRPFFFTAKPHPDRRQLRCPQPPLILAYCVVTGKNPMPVICGQHAIRRRRALRKSAATVKADGLLVSRAEDVHYLSGFTGGDSYLLVAREAACLITDGRYGEQAGRQCRGVDVHVRTGRMVQAVSEVLKGRRIRRLGFQAEHMTVRGRDALAAELGPRRIRPIHEAVADLRAVKDDSEVRRIRRSVRVAERAFRGLLAAGAKAFLGRSERELAAELDYRMRLAGAECPAFETIVAAGANASLPHYRPGSRKPQRGEGVLIDWGAKVNGYCSDLTRVVFLGTIPPKIATVYKVVLAAQKAASAAARAGVSCKTVDSAARKVIAAAGYGRQFIHGLGHGIGLEIHEAPQVTRADDRRLRAGMVITVEPGIYLPGFGGVRIEDDVLVTRQGPQRLSSLPRTLAAMTLQTR